MNREERIAQLRDMLHERGLTLRNYPEGHPSRDAYLAESAEYTAELEKLKNDDSMAGVLVLGFLLAVGGVTLTFLWTPWLLILAALGVLMIIGAL